MTQNEIRSVGIGRNPMMACLLLMLGVWLFSNIIPVNAEPATQSKIDRAALITVDGAIGPAISDYVERGIQRAHERGDTLVILKLDTPGGLDSAMRDIIRVILTSPVPIVGYVAPPGARAASAGTFILYACHIAAMSPATNLGAATPVQIGGLPSLPEPEERNEKGDDSGNAADEAPAAAPATGSGAVMSKKAINDAVAYIQGLARMRGRNAVWAEQAVREAASLTAHDALEANVINYIADDERALLQQLNGKQITINGNQFTLATEHTVIDPIEPDWRTELLAVIASPNVAYILLLLGIYGLLFELANPGATVPGVVGAICLLVAMFALQMLPVNYVGLALVLVGIAFMIGELFVPSFGALGVGGLVAFAMGSLILFDSDSPQFRVSISIVFAITLLTVAFLFVAVRSLVAARRGPVVSGRDQLVGSYGRAIEDFDKRGLVRVHGEIWSAATDHPINCGDPIKVTTLEGLTLHVEPLEEASP